jgi:pimeloyl-ACP methyl ester carboxylesterase
MIAEVPRPSPTSNTIQTAFGPEERKNERFDGVVAYDVFFDMGATARRYVPPTAFWLHDHGFATIVDVIIRIKAAMSPGFAWAISNGMWALGTKHPLQTVAALQKYTLAGVAQRIKGDVLILAGAEDHFVPIEQVAQFEKALTSARSVTTKIYDGASGGAEHCQFGAQALWHADFFDWMVAKFRGCQPHRDNSPRTGRTHPVGKVR